MSYKYITLGYKCPKLFSVINMGVVQTAREGCNLYNSTNEVAAKFAYTCLSGEELNREMKNDSSCFPIEKAR